VLTVLNQIMQGKPSPLLSSFRLSYYTLLNLMKRVEGGTHDLEYVIANSFQQFQQEQAMPKVRPEGCVVLFDILDVIEHDSLVCQQIPQFQQEQAMPKVGLVSVMVWIQHNMLRARRLIL
jgi:hypothetical protein